MHFCSLSAFSTSWFRKCWCGTIATTFSHFPERGSQGRHPFATCSQLLDCDDKCIIVGSVTHERPSLQQMAKWRNLPVLSTGAFTLFCHVVHGFKEDFISFFVSFVLVSCSRVCLLDVSRLLGLTLRHFAPVCFCHRDFLTCWIRRKPHVLSFSASSRCMCLVVSDSLLGRSIHAMLKYEGSASLVKLFFTPSSNPCLSRSVRPYIRETPGRARNVSHPGALNVPSRIVRTNQTNFLNTDSLVCDFFVQVRGCFQANPPFDQSSFVAAFVVEFPKPSWV